MADNGTFMKEKIIKIDKHKEGIALPEEYLRRLELIPGSEVEVCLDKKRKWIILRPLDSDDFIEHFRDSMESMA
jgi:bifunctional DNA-binding transcriptional regulator/antitoxin component of YhaV-PrlF toxin-antitoxin module